MATTKVAKRYLGKRVVHRAAGAKGVVTAPGRYAGWWMVKFDSGVCGNIPERLLAVLDEAKAERRSAG